MEYGDQSRTPLTSEEKTLLSDELTKIEAKLAEIFHNLNTDEEEFPQHVKLAYKMIFPLEHEKAFKKNVQDGEKLLTIIKELKVKNSI